MFDSLLSRYHLKFSLFAFFHLQNQLSVEIISLIDPIIFKFDGFIYAMVTILWGMIIGLTSSQAKNWADDI